MHIDSQARRPPLARRSKSATAAVPWPRGSGNTVRSGGFAEFRRVGGLRAGSPVLVGSSAVRFRAAGFSGRVAPLGRVGSSAATRPQYCTRIRAGARERPHARLPCESEYIGVRYPIRCSGESTRCDGQGPTPRSPADGNARAPQFGSVGGD